MFGSSAGNTFNNLPNLSIAEQSINPAELPWLSVLTPPSDQNLYSQSPNQSLQKESYLPHDPLDREKHAGVRPQPVRRTRRVSSHSSSSTTTNENISPERAKHLERNRISANKCRLKKKKEHARMESILHTETRKRDALLSEVGLLKDELWYLKNMIFEHAQCDNPHINHQLAMMTEQVLSKSPSSAASVSPVFTTKTKLDGALFEAVEHDKLPSKSVPPLSCDTSHEPGLSDVMFDNLVNILE
ncbi:hypothetical protein PDE_05602 [Penicillium oxalicum 114-2]|uniref:BZIP domain-containing protein n=2 Tax=Penicillium oxalicum TaxID=69781 RepID=S7ZJ27_PENO1|nr:hypothetical protein PDE_05602 [Penicillium oxalicum 114-2]